MVARRAAGGKDLNFEEEFKRDLNVTCTRKYAYICITWVELAVRALLRIDVSTSVHTLFKREEFFSLLYSYEHVVPKVYRMVLVHVTCCMHVCTFVATFMHKKICIQYHTAGMHNVCILQISAARSVAHVF